MSTLQVTTIQSNSTTAPPSIQNSAGTEYGTFCRAWVNFNGTGVVAIRASFNVSSITDNGAGDYTVNFTNALVDANYSVVSTCSKNATGDVDTNGSCVQLSSASPLTSSSARICATLYATSSFDRAIMLVSVFR